MKEYYQKYRRWVGLAAILAVISIIILAVRPMLWLGRFGLGWVLCWLLIAMTILIPYTWIAHNTKNWIKSVIAVTLCVILIAGTIYSILFFINATPELKAWEVKIVANDYFIKGRVTAVEYVDKSIWKVKLIGSLYGGAVVYTHYDEKTGTFGVEPTGAPYQPELTDEQKAASEKATDEIWKKIFGK